MKETMKTFLNHIRDCSDKELMSVSIYDAASLCDEESEFDILANSIADELVERELPVNQFIKARSTCKQLFVYSVRKRNSLLSFYRRATYGPIMNCAPIFDDLLKISASLNEYEPDQSETDEHDNMEDMLPIPDDYEWGKKGELLHYINDNCDTEVVYPDTIYVKRLLLNKYDDEDEKEKAEISFVCDGKEKIKRMTLKNAYNNTSVLELANSGAFVNNSNSAKLATYFFDYMKTFRHTIERAYLTKQIGWQDEKEHTEFVPYTSNLIYDDDQYKTVYNSILRSSGTVSEWAALINPYRDKNHIPFRIILATSFASVLVEPLMYQPFFLSIIGRTQLGKTPSLIVVASVWADPSTRAMYVKSMSGHDEALEIGAQFYGSLPYCINESQNRTAQVKNPSIDRLIYMLGDGKPRTRALGSGGLRPQAYWCNAIIYTGEETLSSEKLGARMRVFDLTITDKIISSNEKETESLCQELLSQYNTAGPEFIRRLVSEGGIQEAKKINEGFRKQIPTNVETRQNHIAATILTADTLLAKWIFNDSNCLTVDDLLPYLKVKTDADQEKTNNAEIHERIEQWIQRQITTNGKIETAYGKVKAKRGKSPEAYVFRKGVLEKLVSDYGGELYPYLEWAKQNNKLASGAGHPYESQQHFSDDETEKEWYYTIYLPSEDK